MQPVPPGIRGQKVEILRHKSLHYAADSVISATLHRRKDMAICYVQESIKKISGQKHTIGSIQ